MNGTLSVRVFILLQKDRTRRGGSSRLYSESRDWEPAWTKKKKKKNKTGMEGHFYNPSYTMAYVGEF
jgi:hypothetical protein